MNNLNVCIVGGGNISNTRHIPALNVSKGAKIIGVIGKNRNNVLLTARKHKIQNFHIIDDTIENSHISELEWINEIDAVVIGVPPKDHYDVTKYFLNLRKHVLLEKPMTMTVDESDDLIKLSEKNNLIFGVMHNFQFSNGVSKLEKLIKDEKIGEISSFFEIQLTNNSRRLPIWHNELPLGLFYDEAAHFIYLLHKFGGDIKVLSSYGVKNKTGVNTPLQLTVNLEAGDKPVLLYMNFGSPICEWYFCIIGSKQLAYYDFFRDILITVPNDGLHLAKDVFSNSFNASIKHWCGFIMNGFSLVSNKLFWGHDVAMQKFLNAIENGDRNLLNGIDAKFGRQNVEILNEIVNKTQFS